LLWGKADLAAFSDAVVADPDLKALGEKLSFVDDPSFSFEAVEVCVLLEDGRKLVRRIDGAKGGLAHPMSNAELAQKFKAQIDWRGIAIDGETLIAALEGIENAIDATSFLGLARAR
jgi:2-methylcitrate dehydratase PrpD